MKTILFLLAGLLAFTATASIARAQVSAAGEPHVISLVHPSDAGEDQFTLRISRPYAVNSCASAREVQAYAEFQDTSLSVTVGGRKTGGRIRAIPGCDRRTHTPMADILLNRVDFLTRGVKTVQLRESGETNRYTVSLTKNHILLRPEAVAEGRKIRFVPQKIPGRKRALESWFYPAGTLVLWVPAAEENDEGNALRAFAQERGLLPLETFYPDFESPLLRTDYHYFVDMAGRYDDNDPGLANGKMIGTVAGEKRIYGLDKDVIVPQPLPVYAKHPGLYD